MTDKHDQKSSADETAAPGGSGAPRRTGSDMDPLAELIRLVKEEDPFADVLARKPGPLSGQRATPKAEGRAPAPRAPAALPSVETPRRDAAPAPARPPAPAPPPAAARPPAAAQQVEARAPAMPRASQIFSAGRPAAGEGASSVAPQRPAASGAMPPAAAPGLTDTARAAPASGGEPAARSQDETARAARTHAPEPPPAPAPEPAHHQEPPALDPADLERALRDFRDAPEHVLRADAGWHDDVLDDGHEEPGAYSQGAAGYAAPPRADAGIAADAPTEAAQDAYGDFDPVDPYDDPAFDEFDEAGYGSEESAGGDPYEGESAEPYLPGEAIEEAVDERVDMGETIAYAHAAGQEPKPRRRGTFFAVGILLGLVVLGGGFAYVMSGTTAQVDGEAPILRADTSPAKIEPDEPGGANIPNQDRLVFDRITGESSGGREQLVSREEEILEPGDAAKQSGRFGEEESSGSAMAQAGRESAVSPGAADSSRQAALSPDATDAGLPAAPVPRRVRTMVVRPDGSIVAADPEPMRAAAEPVTTQAAAGATGAPAATAGSEPASGAKSEERAVSALASGSSSSGAVPAPPSRPESAPAAVSSPGSAPSSSVTPVSPVRGAPLPLNPNPVTRRTADGGSPTTPAESAPATSTNVPRQVAAAPPSSALAASSSGEYVVQLAARKNEEQAQGAFNELKAKYSNLLSRYQPLIQRADLGERGVYYRVRVGPMASADAADELCNRLKAAGLPDCLVRQR